MKEKKKVYICYSAYHLLITIIKALQSDERFELVVFEMMPDSEKYAKALEKLKLFDKITIFRHKDNERLFKYPRVSDMITKKKSHLALMKKEIDFSFLDNREIYLYNDGGTIGTYLNLSKIRYNLIEDALDTFKLPLMEKYHKMSVKGKIAHFLNMGVFSFGKSRYTKSLELNDTEGIDLKALAPVKTVPRSQMFARLTEEDKAVIVKIYLGENHKFSVAPSEQGSTLLLTQPLYIDKEVKNQECQIALYKEILKNHALGTVFIKPHPRDLTDYANLFPDCVTISEKNVPLEVFSFVPGIRFERAITAFSTAIQSLDFVKEKIVIGHAWVYEFDKNFQ